LQQGYPRPIFSAPYDTGYDHATFQDVDPWLLGGGVVFLFEGLLFNRDGVFLSHVAGTAEHGGMETLFPKVPRQCKGPKKYQDDDCCIALAFLHERGDNLSVAGGGAAEAVPAGSRTW
jgi:hypothetical protein